MIVIMYGLYRNENIKAYYRKLGDCFDFCSSRKFASDLTEEEAENVLSHEKWFCDQYGASHMTVEK